MHYFFTILLALVFLPMSCFLEVIKIQPCTKKQPRATKWTLSRGTKRCHQSTDRLIFLLGATWTMLKTFGCLCSAEAISCCVCCGFQHEQHMHRVKWGLVKKGLGRRPHTAVLQKHFQKKHCLSSRTPEGWGVHPVSRKMYRGKKGRTKMWRTWWSFYFYYKKLERSRLSGKWLKVH